MILKMVKGKVKKFRDTRKNKLSIKYKSNQIHFDLTNNISKQWFLPRYRNGDLHEPSVCHLIHENLSDNGTFIDIGANLGFFSVLFAKIRPNSQVYSIEIDPNLIALIEENAKLNSITNLHIIHAAIHNCTGMLIDYAPIQNDNLSTNTIISNNTKVHSHVSSITVTLDDMIKDKNINSVDVVKIDVEGAEIFAIEAMYSMLKKLKPVVLMELHSKAIETWGYNTENILNTFENFNYRCYAVHSHRSYDYDITSVDWKNLTHNQMLIFYPNHTA